MASFEQDLLAIFFLFVIFVVIYARRTGKGFKEILQDIKDTFGSGTEEIKK